jgi:hypothetical protein
MEFEDYDEYNSIIDSLKELKREAEKEANAVDL